MPKNIVLRKLVVAGK